jgi:hypothetical protein
MKKIILAVLSFWALNLSAGDFQDWLKKDAAMRSSMDSQVSIGDFRLKLPLGWVVDKQESDSSDVVLLYIGPQIIAAAPKIKAHFSVETGSAVVKRGIERDIQPENSWVVAKRKEPRPMREVARNMPDDISRAHINWWPFRFTSGYELKAGATPLPPSVSTFYSNYKDIGPFPGAKDEGMAMKKIITSLSTALSWLVVPLI